MALQKPSNPRTRLASALDEPEGTKRSDLEQFLDHVRNNPVLYAASVAFVLVCLLAGALYGLYDSSRKQEIQTAYASALQEEDPALVAGSLEKLVEKGGVWAPEIRYMLGEYSLRAQTYSKAEEAFNTVVESYPKSEYAPKALDGLGYIHENRGDYQKALESYRRITENKAWSNTVVGLRQHYNIGRVLEKMEQFEAAREAYDKQIDVFPGSEDQPSMVSQLARGALERLRTEHPELFPDDALAVEDAPAAEVQADAVPDAAPGAVEETPPAEVQPDAASVAGSVAEEAPLEEESAPAAAAEEPEEAPEAVETATEVDAETPGTP